MRCSAKAEKVGRDPGRKTNTITQPLQQSPPRATSQQEPGHPTSLPYPSRIPPHCTGTAGWSPRARHGGAQQGRDRGTGGTLGGSRMQPRAGVGSGARRELCRSQADPAPAAHRIPTELHGLLKRDLGKKKKKATKKPNPNLPHSCVLAKSSTLLKSGSHRGALPVPQLPKSSGAGGCRGCSAAPSQPPRPQTQRLGGAHPPGDPDPCPVSPRYILGTAPRALPAPCWASARVSAD